MNRVSIFGAYSVLSIAIPVGIVVNTVQRERTFFDVVMYLTSSKLNLVVLLNFLFIVLTNAANLLVGCFFGQVRTVESKYLIDKCQKKIFQFLLLTVVLRNTIDIYKMASLLIILSIWMLHWLLAKRTKGLIGEENRDRVTHGRLLTLYCSIITIDGLIAYIFFVQFLKNEKKIDDIYMMVGFEFGRLFLKAVKSNFKYQVSLFELGYHEQWLEKKFVFNVVSLCFDTCDFLINSRLFFIIVSRGTLPIYILSEIADNLSTLGHKGVALIKWRQFIQKLKKLQDVEASEEDGAQTYQCCICLGDIKKGKQLSCSHVFHLICLRQWLIEKVECPTCRKPIQLDRQPEQPGRRRLQNQNLERRLRVQRDQRRNAHQRVAAAVQLEGRDRNQVNRNAPAGDTNPAEPSTNAQTDDAAAMQPPPIDKGNPKGIFDDHKEKARKAEKKIRVHQEAKYAKELDQRLKKLIEKNRQVTQSQIEKVQAYRDDTKKRLDAYQEFNTTIQIVHEKAEKARQEDLLLLEQAAATVAPTETVSIKDDDSLETIEVDTIMSPRDQKHLELEAGDKEVGMNDESMLRLNREHENTVTVETKPKAGSLLDEAMPEPLKTDRCQVQPPTMALSKMNKFIASDSSDSNQLLPATDAYDKEILADKSLEDEKPTTTKIPLSQEQRAKIVTDRLFELQQKHKEISEKVQSVLVDTCDFAFGTDKKASMQSVSTPGWMKTAKKIENEKQRRMAARRRKLIALQVQKMKQQKAKEEQQALMDQMAYTQGVGSVPYGLPCLAVTRRNQTQQYQQYELERVNLKLCQVMRTPADFVDVEQESDESDAAGLSDKSVGSDGDSFDDYYSDDDDDDLSAGSLPDQGELDGREGIDGEQDDEDDYGDEAVDGAAQGVEEAY